MARAVAIGHWVVRRASASRGLCGSGLAGRQGMEDRARARRGCEAGGRPWRGLQTTRRGPWQKHGAGLIEGRGGLGRRPGRQATRGRQRPALPRRVVPKLARPSRCGDPAARLAEVARVRPCSRSPNREASSPGQAEETAAFSQKSRTAQTR